MGESRQKQRAHQKVLEDCPFCVYCGGSTPASTIEHMPPRMMFDGKQRPKGLEFAACKSCNTGSSHADLVAALVGRSGIAGAAPPQEGELLSLLQAVRNNIPGLLEEMEPTAEDEERWLRTLPPMPEAGGMLMVGPLMTAYLRAFSLKLGLALHYEVTRRILRPAGAISVRWFSNYEQITGAFPQSVFDILLPPRTLRQGKTEVSSQFQYSWRLTDGGEMGLYFASFRTAFAVLAFTASTRDKLLHPGFEERVFSPEEVGRLLAAG